MKALGLRFLTQENGDSQPNSRLHRLHLLKKYDQFPHKSRGKKAGDVASGVSTELPLINSRRSNSLRRKSKNQIDDFFKKEEIAARRETILASVEGYSEEYRKYRRKHYRP